MTKKIHLEGISMVSSFPYPRLDTVYEPGSTPNLWYGRCMLGYTGGKLRLFSGVKVTERIDFEDFGLGSRPTSYCPEDPDLPKAIFSLITGISPKYLDPKRFKEVKPGKCKCKNPVKIHQEDPEGTWDKFVCARCLKLVKKNGE
jgi:hypothetical protein